MALTAAGGLVPVMEIGGTDMGGGTTLGFSFSLVPASSLASSAGAAAGGGVSTAGLVPPVAGSADGIGTRTLRVTFCGAASGVPTPAAVSIGGEAGDGGGTRIGGADFLVSNGVIDIRGFRPALPGSVGWVVVPVGGTVAPAGGVDAPAGGMGAAVGGLTGMGGADFLVSNGVIDIRGFRPILPGSVGGVVVPVGGTVVPVGGVVAPAGGTGAAVGGLTGMGGADFLVSNGVMDIRNLGRGASAAAGAAGGVAEEAGGGGGDGVGSVLSAGGGAGGGWPGSAGGFTPSFTRGS